MYKLAEQSANGTYDDEVDRAQLQKEVNKLSEEIDRIADSANFNGIKLLDGSLSDSGANSTNKISLDLSKLGVDLTVNSKTVTATKGKYETQDLLAQSQTYTSGINNMVNGDTIKVKLDYLNGGEEASKEITLKIGNANNGGTAAKGIYLDDGSENGVWLTDMAASAGGTVAKTDLSKALEQVFQKDNDLKSMFKFTDKTGAFEVEARERGTTGAILKNIEISVTDADGKGANAPITDTWSVGVKQSVKAEDEFQAVNFATATTYQGKVFDMTISQDSATTVKNIEDAIFEVNGKKFAFIQNGKKSDQQFLAALRDAGVEHWVEVATADTIAAADVTNMVDKIAKETGLLVEQGKTTVNTTTGETTWANDTTGTEVIFRLPEASTKNSGAGGLELQIGDTADSFNIMKVQVKDCHSKAIGIGGIDISKQGNAQKALDAIKAAKNYTSDVRGELGATQNRLDHTINNLSVMQENIQDAESTIRDVDVAKEMMNYTKNNILVQSAQAMLAQANQLPQGVLQLLG